MLCRTIDVIKKDKTQISGTVRLAIGERNAPVRPSTPSRTVPQGSMQARLIDSNGEYALIEVACSCGCRTQIQCQYTAETAKV
jgi:hypothetical protein